MFREGHGVFSFVAAQFAVIRFGEMLLIPGSALSYRLVYNQIGRSVDRTLDSFLRSLLHDIIGHA